MKLKSMTLILIFLLAALTLGAASASENTTNDISSTIDDLTSSADDEVISDDCELEKNDEKLEIVSDIEQNCENASDSSDFQPEGKEIPSVLGASDDNEKLELSECDIYINDFLYYDAINDIYVSVGAHKGIADVYINDEKVASYDMEYSNNAFQIVIPKITSPTLNVKIDYKGDGVTYNPKTVNKTIEVTPTFKGEDVEFGTSGNFTFLYPSNGESVRFVLYDNSIIDDKTVIINNSKAVYTTPDNLEFGKKYRLTCYYKNYYETKTFTVMPKINIPKNFYYKDIQNVTIEFPEEYKNFNVTIDIDNKHYITNVINNDSKVNFNLQILKRPNTEHHMVITISDGNNTVHTLTKNLGPTKYLPDIDFDLKLSNEYVTGKILDLYANADALYIFDPVITILIDGEIYKTFRITSNEFIIPTKLFKSREINNLTFKISNTTYLKPFVKEYLFKIKPYLVNIPQNPKLNNGEFIEVVLPNNAAGTVTLYVDGKQVSKASVSKDNCEEGNNIARFPLDSLNLKMGSHTLRAVYTGTGNNFDITKKFNLGYSIRTDLKNTYNYGQNTVMFKLPNDAKGSFKIFVDGEQYKEYKKSGANINVDISKLIGTHEISFEYSGDSKYNYPLTVKGNFNVTTNIEFDNKIYYKTTNDHVRLTLPEDAKGNLIVEINDTVYLKKTVVNGKAVISLYNLTMGLHDFKAYYDGADYNVSVIDDDIIVDSKIFITKTEFNYDEAVDIYLNLPENYKGTLKVNYNGKKQTANMVNGSAKIRLDKPKVGNYGITASFNGNRFWSDEHFEVIVKPILILPKFTTFEKSIVKVKFPEDFKGKLTIGGFYEYGSNVKINAKGGVNSASLKIMRSGYYYMTIDYKSSDGSQKGWFEYKIYVNPAKNPKLIASSQSLYCGDLYSVKVLNVKGLPLKGAKITIKVGKNKAITKTTNSKGWAKLPMTYKPGKYTVTVKYAKQTLKPKVTVKKVLSLKKVTVKKSAKKLKLTATLKRGKTPIKSKTVTFKFNGKKYSAKTNKKGIAKVTIKKTVLKKLKVGKKITYQATYLKDTVKKSVKVKK